MTSLSRLSSKRRIGPLGPLGLLHVTSMDEEEATLRMGGDKLVGTSASVWTRTAWEAVHPPPGKETCGLKLQQMYRFRRCTGSANVQLQQMCRCSRGGIEWLGSAVLILASLYVQYNNLSDVLEDDRQTSSNSYGHISNWESYNIS